MSNRLLTTLIELHVELKETALEEHREWALQPLRAYLAKEHPELDHSLIIQTKDQQVDVVLEVEPRTGYDFAVQSFTFRLLNLQQFGYQMLFDRESHVLPVYAFFGDAPTVHPYSRESIGFAMLTKLNISTEAVPLLVLRPELDVE